MTLKPKHLMGGVAAFLIAGGMVFAQPALIWNDTHIPGEVVLTALDSLPGGVLAGTQSGRIYRSVDQGKTWKLALDQAGDAIQNFARIGNLLFAAAGSRGDLGLWDCFSMSCVSPVVTGGLFKSIDSGAHWLKVPEIESVTDFADSGNSIMACGLSGVYRSNDQGGNWVKLLNQNSTESPNTQYVTGFTWQTKTKELVLTTWRGEVWTAPSEANLIAWKSIAKKGAKALARAGNLALISFAADSTGPVGPTGGIAYTLDDGAHWKTTSKSKYRLLGGRGTSLFGASDSGIFRSDDSGASWKIFAGPLPGRDTASLAVGLPGSVLATVWGKGVWSNTGTGNSWLKYTEGFHTGAVKAVALHGGEIMAVEANSDFYRRSAGSAGTWIAPVSIGWDTYGYVLASTHSSFFFGGQKLQGGDGSSLTAAVTPVSNEAVSKITSDGISTAY